LADHPPSHTIYPKTFPCHTHDPGTFFVVTPSRESFLNYLAPKGCVNAGTAAVQTFIWISPALWRWHLLLAEKDAGLARHGGKLVELIRHSYHVGTVN